jgi:hypothetical protein
MLFYERLQRLYFKYKKDERYFSPLVYTIKTKNKRYSVFRFQSCQFMQTYFTW